MHRIRPTVLFCLALIALFSVACKSTSAAPAPAQASDPSAQRQLAVAKASPVASVTPPAAAGQAKDASSYKSQVVEGGSVTVEVLPLTLKAGAPSEFEIAMNTHSVDLSADMLKAVVLIDDAGKEYTATKWDGPTGGGHHRSGRILFPALSASAKSVTVVVKGIAKVPERKFQWDLVG